MTQIEEGAFPGAAAAFGTAERCEVVTVGRTRYDDLSPKVTEETVFDLASLTKVLATTTAAMKVFGDLDRDLSRPVKDVIPDFRGEDVTIGHLLRHDSGLPAYDWTLAGTSLDEAETRSRILGVEPERPPGEATVYSCLNFVALQEIIERISGRGLREWVREESVGDFLPVSWSQGSLDVAPTARMEGWRPGLSQWRSNPSLSLEFVEGVVHDPVAYYLGGVSGNAGLFGSILELQRYGRRWVSEPEGFSKEWRRWTTRQSPASSRGLGWDTKSAEGSSCGTWFSPSSFGHLGFTGTSLWVDPERGVFAALLTNRVHPDQENLKIQQVRPKFHDLVGQWIDDGID